MLRLLHVLTKSFMKMSTNRRCKVQEGPLLADDDANDMGNYPFTFSSKGLVTSPVGHKYFL